MGQQPFEESPFALTATPRIGACWAGRPDILKKIQRLLRSLTNRPDSTLDLIWANFGAGKSHALFHISHLLGAGEGQPIALFVEIPEQLKRFTEVYSKIISALPWARLAPSIALASAEEVSQDLRQVARIIAHGTSAERAIAMEWLSAGRPLLRELRKYAGISTRIETDAQATDILSDLLNVLAAHKIRLVLLLDEFQRLGGLPERYRSALLSNIRSLFSRHPTHFSVIAAATTRVEKSAQELLPQELRTLMGMRPSIGLPEMSEEEAYAFVIERFRCFRHKNYRGGDADPLGEVAVQETIRFISQQPNTRLTPRTVLQALAWLYDEIDTDNVPLSAEQTSQLLSQLSWDTPGVDANG